VSGPLLVLGVIAVVLAVDLLIGWLVGRAVWHGTSDEAVGPPGRDRLP
jgi:hypothetical protein